MRLFRFRGLTIALLAIVTFALAACGGDDGGSSTNSGPFTDDPTAIQGLATVSEFPVEIPRSDGKTVTLDAPPTKVVSLSPAATEIM